MKKTLGLLIALVLVVVASSAAVVVGRAYAANTEMDEESAVSADLYIGADEIEGLLFMREEEKLARDVYLTLYDQWNLSIFKNIAASESAHMDAILTLLERYGIDDPAAGKDVGEFTNPDLQTSMTSWSPRVRSHSQMPSKSAQPSKRSTSWIWKSALYKQTWQTSSLCMKAC